MTLTQRIKRIAALRQYALAYGYSEIDVIEYWNKHGFEETLKKFPARRVTS